MNKSVATVISFACLAGIATAVYVALGRNRATQDGSLENMGAIDQRIKRVVDHKSKGVPESTHSGDRPSVNISIDIEQDWNRYEASASNDVSLESLVRGASQPHVSEEARIRLCRKMLVPGISQDEGVKRLKAVMDIAESTDSRNVASVVLDAYAGFPSVVKAVAVARTVTADGDFLSIAVKCANSTDLNNSDDIAALNSGISMASAINRERTDEFIKLLPPNVNKLVSVKVDK